MATTMGSPHAMRSSAAVYWVAGIVIALAIIVYFATRNGATYYSVPVETTTEMSTTTEYVTPSENLNTNQNAMPATEPNAIRNPPETRIDGPSSGGGAGR